jgi:hypothetical protein
MAWVINSYLFLSLRMAQVWYRSMFWLNDKERKPRFRIWHMVLYVCLVHTLYILAVIGSGNIRMQINYIPLIDQY